MSSISDIQQIHGMLQEISRLLDEVDTKTDNVTTKTKTTTEGFRQLEQIAVRYLVLTRRMGLPEDVQQAVDVLMRMIITIRQLQLAASLLMLGTPYGYLMAAAGLGIIALTAAEGF
jgi:hypothetical protein